MAVCRQRGGGEGLGLSSTPVRFGILPIGSAAESLEERRPLLDDLQKRWHPVTTVSVGEPRASPALPVQSARGGRTRSFSSGSYEAVTHQHMQVFAQFVRNDGAKGNRCWLRRRAPPQQHPQPRRPLAMLAAAGVTRARSGHLSVTEHMAARGLRVRAARPHSTNVSAACGWATTRKPAAEVNGEADVARSNNPGHCLRRSLPARRRSSSGWSGARRDSLPVC